MTSRVPIQTERRICRWSFKVRSSRTVFSCPAFSLSFSSCSFVHTLTTQVSPHTRPTRNTSLHEHNNTQGWHVPSKLREKERAKGHPAETWQPRLLAKAPLLLEESRSRFVIVSNTQSHRVSTTWRISVFVSLCLFVWCFVCLCCLSVSVSLCH